MAEEYLGAGGSGWKILAVGEGKNILYETTQDAFGIRRAFDHSETSNDGRTRKWFHARMENGVPTALYEVRFKEVWGFKDDATLGRVARAREFGAENDILINEKGEKVGEVLKEDGA